jgi:hypothetical protein
VSDYKRKCIFTGGEANSRLRLAISEPEKHNWAKDVPCSKDFSESLNGRNLTDLEFKLVELFYAKELCRLKIENYEKEMADIRELLATPKERQQFEEIKKMVKKHKMEVKKEDKQVTKEKNSDKLVEASKPKSEDLWG